MIYREKKNNVNVNLQNYHNNHLFLYNFVCLIVSEFWILLVKIYKFFFSYYDVSALNMFDIIFFYHKKKKKKKACWAQDGLK